MFYPIYEQFGIAQTIKNKLENEYPEYLHGNQHISSIQFQHKMEIYWKYDSIGFEYIMLLSSHTMYTVHTPMYRTNGAPLNLFAYIG